MDEAQEIPPDVLTDLINSKSEVDRSQFVPAETLHAEMIEAMNRIEQKAAAPLQA